MRLLCLLSLLLSTSLAQAEPALIDLQRALKSVSAGKAAHEALRVLTQTRQSQLDRLREALETRRTDIEKKPTSKSPAAWRAYQYELQRKAIALQQQYRRIQHELRAEEERLTRPILARLRRIAMRIGTERGVSIFFDAEQTPMLWVARRLDLTDELIQRFERGDGRVEW